MKQAISILILLAIIIILDTITLFNTDNSIKILSEDIESLKSSIEEEIKNEIDSNMEKLENDWKKCKESLSFYIEHDELEKVETEIVAFKSNIEVEEYETASEQISKAKFILEHIAEKNKLRLKNIF